MRTFLSRPASATDTPAVGRGGRAAEACLGAFAIWYLSGLLAAIGFSFGLYLVQPASLSQTEHRDPFDALTWMDGKWYKQIAVAGYDYDPDARSNIAFFPVFPLLARALMSVSGLRAEVALLIISNLSLLAALAALGLYAQARNRDGPAEWSESEWVVVAAALFPTGCFFRLAYSESTFLLLAVVAMYAMRRRWPLFAVALVVGLATAARPVGVALLAPLAIHVFRRAAAAGDGRAVSWPGLLRSSLYLPLACWGLLAFMVYQYTVFDDPLASFHVQRHWTIRGPFTGYERAAALATFEPIRAVYQAGSPAFWVSSDRHGIPWFSLQFANPLFFVGAIGLIAAGAWRRWLTLEEVALAALLLLIPYLTRGYEMGMASTGRFVAVAFPIYLVLGELLSRLPGAVRAALAALSGLFLAVYTALYAAGMNIF